MLAIKYYIHNATYISFLENEDATFNISAGRIEGINNKIKTLRRKGYGYPDDDYFFLKLFDVSRKPYIRNPSSHNVYD